MTSEQAAKRRPYLAICGVGLAAALALWAWWPPADDEVGHPANSGANARAKADLPSATSSALLERPMPATSTTAQLAPSFAHPSAAIGAAVPITVVGPNKIVVREMNDLIIGISANAGVHEISFTVQFDPNVLQVRAGTEGSWAMGAGSNARFSAEIPEDGSRVQIRSAVSGQHVGAAGGSVAVVQFQAVGPGTTSVLITDMSVNDSEGRAIAATVSPSDLHITVDSTPPPQPEIPRHLRAVAVEPATETTEVGD